MAIHSSKTSTSVWRRWVYQRFQDAVGGVSSVFGRGGDVTAEQADYDSFFLTPTEGNAAYLGISAKAADSELLDGINGSNYLRSNVPDVKQAGNLTFNDNIKAIFGTAGGLEIYRSGATNYIVNVADNFSIEQRINIGVGKISANDAGGVLTLCLQWGGNDPAVNLFYDGVEKLATIPAGISVTGDIVVSGDVDGRDIEADGTKLDGIISGAQTISVFGRTGAVTALQADYDSFFLTPSEGDAAYLGISAKAADSELLDGIDGSDYARTDIAETFDDDVIVTGALSSDGFYSDAIGHYSLLLNVPTATNVDIPWKAGVTNLDTQFRYRFSLVTTATGTVTGSSYVVWHNGTVWVEQFISRGGSSSNHPLLTINTGTGRAQAFHNHGSTYNFQITVDYRKVVETDALPHIYGADYMWQRDINALIYSDGNVDIAAGNLTLSGDVDGRDVAADGILIDELGTTYLGISSKAVDSELLDGVNGTNYLRSNVDDVLSGQLQIIHNLTDPKYDNGQLELKTSNGSDVSLGFHRGNFTACQLRHESNGLILSGTSRTNAANFNCLGNILVGGTVDGIDIATDVAANTAKVTNATHTGDVAGDTALTIQAGAVEQSMMADNAVGLAEMAHGTDGNLITYNTSGAPAFVATGTSGQLLTSKGAGQVPVFEAGGPQLQTPIVTTSGTTHDFTSIPSWVKRITVIIDGVSTNGGEELIIQIGDSGGFHTSSYLGSTTRIIASAVLTASETEGFPINVSNAGGAAYSGIGTMVRIDTAGTKWIWESTNNNSSAAVVNLSSARVTLDTVLTQVRLTSTGTPNTFDAGTFNITWE